MLYNIVMLSLGVGCVVIALICFIFALPFIFESEDDTEEVVPYKERRTALVVVTVVFLITTAFAFVDFYYFAYNAPNYLTGFAAWYAVGFLARVAYLIWSHQLFSPILATEETEIFALFFIAIGGPFVIYLALKEVIRQKSDPFHDINKML